MKDYSTFVVVYAEIKYHTHAPEFRGLCLLSKQVEPRTSRINKVIGRLLTPVTVPRSWSTFVILRAKLL